MSRTRRRRWMPTGTDPGGVHLVVDREQTCKPGCTVCGKPRKRADRRRQRHDQRRRIIAELQ